MMCDELAKYRAEIDKIDEQLHCLYKKRIAISRQIGIYKNEQQQPVLDMQREVELKKQLRNHWCEEADVLAYVYLQDAMMRVSRNAQYVYQERIPNFTNELPTPTLVGYHDDVKSSALVAAKKVFGQVEKMVFATNGKLMQAVDQNDITYGVIALGNSAQVFDLLERYPDVYIVGEVFLGETVEQFAILSKRIVVPEKATKTAVSITSFARGGFAQAISQFQYEEIDILTITAHPFQENRFLVEFAGCLYDANVQRLLERLESELASLRVLGSYRKYE